MYMRFKWNPAVRYDPSAWLGLGNLKKPSRVFVGSTMELFDDRLSGVYLKWILEVPLEFPQHTFIFLTKQPQHLPKKFLGNCWVGVTATDALTFDMACRHLYEVDAQVRFVSMEPFLSWQPWFSIKLPPHLNWVIIGQQTPVSAKTQPKIEWIREIVEAADKAGIPVFLKNNLKPLIESTAKHNAFLEFGLSLSEGELRQEMPK
jgi:protein gp37